MKITSKGLEGWLSNWLGALVLIKDPGSTPSTPRKLQENKECLREQLHTGHGMWGRKRIVPKSLWVKPGLPSDIQHSPLSTQYSSELELPSYLKSEFWAVASLYIHLKSNQTTSCSYPNTTHACPFLSVVSAKQLTLLHLWHAPACLSVHQPVP